MGFRTCVCLALVAAALGCGGSEPDAIDFQATGGLLGSRYGTALHVDLDGPVTRTTPASGTQSATLDRATLDDLQRKIADAQFPQLASSYPGCCDNNIYDVTLQAGDRAIHVVADAGADLPAGLTAVISTLQGIIELPLDWK